MVFNRCWNIFSSLVLCTAIVGVSVLVIYAMMLRIVRFLLYASHIVWSQAVYWFAIFTRQLRQEKVGDNHREVNQDSDSKVAVNLRADTGLVICLCRCM